jgi:tripartite-type tricarboxylate transporter receptor subunit TctC
MKRRNFAISCGVLTLLTTKNWAADFLFRQPLKIVVPAAPGGFTDIAARLVGEKLALRTGNPVVIDNKAGASGMIGSEAVARSAPDGATIVMSIYKRMLLTLGYLRT